MYNQNPYSKSALRGSYYEQPSYPQYDQYYNPPQPAPTYYPQPRYYDPYYEEPQIYEKPPHTVYPEYSLIPDRFASSYSLKAPSYGGDGMITDIEYLDFPFDKTYKRTPLCARSHERILNYSRSQMTPGNQ